MAVQERDEVKDQVAIAIINEAKSLGFYDDPLPESADDREIEAAALVAEAQNAYDKGARGDAVSRILNIASSTQEEEVKPSLPPLSIVPSQSSELPESPPQQHGSQSGLTGVKKAKELAIARIKKERLPIPDAVEGEPPILPRDLSTIADSALRKIHSEFNAVLAYANWLLALEEADELAARQIADYYIALAISSAAQTPDPITNKAKTVAILEAEAYSDTNASEWRNKQAGHFVSIKLFKSLRDTYQSNVERISREYTMREGERAV